VLNALRTVVQTAGRGAILRGDRGIAYREAEHMLNNHRAIIRNLLQFILDSGVKELENLQYIHVGGGTRHELSVLEPVWHFRN